ncbi:MAG: DUF4911 domain-containing protein [Desulfobacterales bacterium]|nr:DUF4911 domain-containing protein [Desulfobacterales bacterium]
MEIKCLNSVRRYYKIPKSEISYLKFIIEAYEGIAVLTTVCPTSGKIVLYIAPGCEDEIDMICAELTKEIPLIPLTECTDSTVL